MKSKLPKNGSWQAGSDGSPVTGPDLELSLRKIEFEVAEGDVELAFTDFDGDNNFDVLYFQNSDKREFNKEENRWVISDRKHEINWQRNLTAQGEPKFAAPAKLFQSPDYIHSFATVDFDQDGQMDIVVNSRGHVRLLRASK